MADDQNQQQQSNTARIQAMLDDLARARAAAKGGGQPQKTPAPQAKPTPPPVNLPTPPPPKPAPVSPTPPTPPTPTPPPAPKPVPPPQPRPAPVPQAPKPAVPPAPPRPTPPQPVPPAPKPALAPRPAPPPPPAPKPPVPTELTSPVTAEVRTMKGDIGQIEVGRAPEGLRSAPAPVAPQTAPKPPAPPRITVPAETKKKPGKIIVFSFLGLVIVVLIVIIVSAFSGGDSTPTPTPSPSASVSLTPAPSATSLSNYFGTPQTSTTTLLLSTDAPFELVNPGNERAIAIAVERSEDGLRAPPNEILTNIFADTPVDVEAAIAGNASAEGVLLAYGQTELFDDAGQPVSGQVVRPVVVLEINNASAVRQEMQAWENAGFAQSALGRFRVDTAKAVVPGFAEGTYKQIPVRYWNFPYADQSIDWSIVLASNGKTYLVIAGSRQAAFYAIDKLLE